VESREASERLLSGLAHLGVGFDAEHRVAVAQEQLGQFSGPRADVGDHVVR
jgi:hypothetical protein